MILNEDQKIQYFDILARLKESEKNEDLAEEKYIELAIHKTNLVRAELDLFIRSIKMEQNIGL